MRLGGKSEVDVGWSDSTQAVMTSNRPFRYLDTIHFLL